MSALNLCRAYLKWKTLLPFVPSSVWILKFPSRNSRAVVLHFYSSPSPKSWKKSTARRQRCRTHPSSSSGERSLLTRPSARQSWLSSASSVEPFSSPESRIDSRTLLDRNFHPTTTSSFYQCQRPLALRSHAYSSLPAASPLLPSYYPQPHCNSRRKKIEAEAGT